MDPCQGSSSRRSTTTTGAKGGRDKKHKEAMPEQPAVDVAGVAAAAPPYRLFPEETGHNSDGLQLHEFFSAHCQRPKLEVYIYIYIYLFSSLVMIRSFVMMLLL